MSGAPLNPADYLPELLGPVVIEVDGVEQPARGTINFAGCTASGDDDKLTITPNGGGSEADGDAGELQTTDGAGALVAATGVKAGAGFISYGATPASTGQLRFTNDLSSAFVRNATDDGDLCAWDADGSNFYLGTDRTFAKTFDTIGLVGVNIAAFYITAVSPNPQMVVYSAAASGLDNTSLWISHIPEILNLGTAQTIAYAREDELHTTDAADHALLSVDVSTSANAGITLDVIVLGIEAGAASMHWYKKSRAWLNTAGVLTAGAQKDVDDEEIGTPPAGTWTVALEDDGSQGLLVNVNGDDDDVTWYVVSQRLRTVPVA